MNVFLLKMAKRIAGKVRVHEEKLVRLVLGAPVLSAILTHILEDKFETSVDLAEQPLTPAVVEALLRQVVNHKFEQRAESGDVFDGMVAFLSGSQTSRLEIAYTKQQQKQKQKQRARDQDSDMMEVFARARARARGASQRAREQGSEGAKRPSDPQRPSGLTTQRSNEPTSSERASQRGSEYRSAGGRSSPPSSRASRHRHRPPPAPPSRRSSGQPAADQRHDG